MRVTNSTQHNSHSAFCLMLPIVRLNVAAEMDVRAPCLTASGDGLSLCQWADLHSRASDRTSVKPSAQRNETETKQFRNCVERVLKQFCVLFQPKQNAPVVKCFSCFSQSLLVSTILCNLSANPEAAEGLGDDVGPMRDVVVVSAGYSSAFLYYLYGGHKTLLFGVTTRVMHGFQHYVSVHPYK